MLRMPTVIAAICITAVLGRALADSPSPQPPKPLTVGQMIDLTVNLSAMDSVETGILDKNGTAVTRPSGFVFPGRTLLRFATILAAGQRVLQSYNDGLAHLRIQLAGEGRDVPKEQLDSFKFESNKMRDESANVSVPRFSPDDLCLDVKPPECPVKNNLPVALMAALDPIIDQ